MHIHNRRALLAILLTALWLNEFSESNPTGTEEDFQGPGKRLENFQKLSRNVVTSCKQCISEKAALEAKLTAMEEKLKAAETRLKAPGKAASTARPVTKLSTQEAADISRKLKQSLIDQAAVMGDIAATRKRIGDAIAQIKSGQKRVQQNKAQTKEASAALKKANDALPAVLKKGKDQLAHASTECSKIGNWRAIDKWLCGLNKECKRNKAAAPAAERLCTQSLPLYKSRLAKYDAMQQQQLGASVQLLFLGRRRSPSRTRRRRQNMRELKAEKKRISNIDVTQIVALRVTLDSSLADIDSAKASAKQNIQRLEVLRKGLKDEQAKLKKAKQTMEQAEAKLHQQEKSQNMCALKLGTIPAITKFSRTNLQRPARASIARQLLSKSNVIQGGEMNAELLQRRRRGSALPQLRVSGMFFRRRRTAGGKKKEEGIDDNKANAGKEKKKRNAGKEKRQDNIHEVKGDEIGLCVLDKDGKVPTSNIHMYCASTTQPEQVRACKTKRGGVILVKQKKQNRITTRDANGGRLDVCVDFIKVSTCGEGESENVECVARKVLYRCRVGQAGECGLSSGRDCNVAEKRIAIIHV